MYMDTMRHTFYLYDFCLLFGLEAILAWVLLKGGKRKEMCKWTSE